MIDFIAFPIGHFLKFIYQHIAFNNYGVAIIELTVIIKTLLLPLYIKQYHATSGISKIQYEMQEIQMPILFSLYYVVSQPLKYVVGKSPAVIQQLFEMIPQGPDRIANMRDLSVINYFSKHLDKLSDVGQLLGKDDLLNMNFLGINLGSVPNLNFHQMNTHKLLILLIPLLAAVSTYISTKYSTNQTSSQTTNNQIQDSMQRSMTLIAPVMTGFMTFTLPVGMGVYWIIGNIYQIFQQMFMNKFVIKKALNNYVKSKKHYSQISFNNYKLS
jgi:YidC/Oxa1 family membrane protein insertase